jgi:hypothetical protein
MSSMMKTNPITPPPELVEQWEEQWCNIPVIRPSINSYIATQAAQWGADQELEACCEWLEKDLDAYELVGLRAVYLDHNLHAARRPKPPSLKKQALEALEALPTPAGQVTADRLDTIRRALEALDD